MPDRGAGFGKLVEDKIYLPVAAGWPVRCRVLCRVFIARIDFWHVRRIGTAKLDVQRQRMGTPGFKYAPTLWDWW